MYYSDGEMSCKKPERICESNISLCTVWLDVFYLPVDASCPYIGRANSYAQIRQ